MGFGVFKSFERYHEIYRLVRQGNFFTCALKKLHLRGLILFCGMRHGRWINIDPHHAFCILAEHLTPVTLSAGNVQDPFAFAQAACEGIAV